MVGNDHPHMYDLHLQFPDIRDYAHWLDHNCAKCIHQQNGREYSCKLLEVMDRSVASMTWKIPQHTADQIGFRTLEDWKKSDTCQKFWSKRRKDGPPSDEAQ